MYRSCLKIVLVALTATCAIASTNSGQFMDRGFGLASCGKWTSEHQAELILASGMDEWVLGYLTSYNRWVVKNGSDIADGTDSDGISAAVTQYCTAHPLDTVAAAAEDLIVQLSTRWSRNHPPVRRSH